MADPGQTSVRPRRSPWPWRRTWAVALVTFRQGVRARLWILVPLAVAAVVVADLSSARFDPVFDAIPSAVGMTLLGMIIVSVLVGLFFATYSLPSEIESRVIYTVTTKPLGRGEMVAGKAVGVSVLLLVMLGCIAAGGYGYMLVRASMVRARAQERLAEAAKRARYHSDLNALEGVIRAGPMQAYRYFSPPAGPDIRIRFPDDRPPDPLVRWALAATEMRLSWDLSSSPVQSWWEPPAAPTPATLRLRLEVRPPPGEKPGPVRAAVRIVPAEAPRPSPVPMARPRASRPLVQQRDLGPTGEVAIPLVPETVEPPDDALAVPVEGGFRVEAWLVSDRSKLAGYAFGARAGALDIAGPGGRTYAAAEPPTALPQVFSDRLWLAGRSALPRQRAVFRFDDVPESLLPPGDVPVEVGCALDTMSPATVETTAEVVFVNPATGRRQEPLPFTPEMYHSSLVFIARDVWHGGPLEVHVECRTDEDFLGLASDSVRLRLDAGPFAWNLAKAGLQVWLFGIVLIAAGVLFSARFSWFVGILCHLAFFIFAMTRGFLFTATPLRSAAEALARSLARLSRAVDWSVVAKHVVLPLPDLVSLLPPESVNRGEALPPGTFAGAAGLALVSAAAMVLLGTLLYRKREVAAS